MSRGITGEENVTLAMIEYSCFEDCSFTKMQKVCRLRQARNVCYCLEGLNAFNAQCFAHAPR
jgi:hypothetical protein